MQLNTNTSHEQHEVYNYYNNRTGTVFTFGSHELAPRGFSVVFSELWFCVELSTSNRLVCDFCLVCFAVEYVFILNFHIRSSFWVRWGKGSIVYKIMSITKTVLFFFYFRLYFLFGTFCMSEKRWKTLHCAL